MDSEVYFFHQGQWLKTKVVLPDAELSGAALTEHLWSACGLDPKLLPVFKVSQTTIAENLRRTRQQPVHEKDLAASHLVLDVQPGSLQDQALVVFIPSPWGSTLGGPWIATPSWAHCERLFACYDPDENHPFIYELALACARIWPGSLRAPEDAPQRFEYLPGAFPHSQGSQGLSLFPPLDRSFPANARVQDSFQTGYCCDFTQGKQTTVALHFPHEPGGSLSDSLQTTLSGLIPVCNDLFFAEREEGGPGQNHGGNVLVSPPVDRMTEALEADEAGPAINAHPPAPLGKLVVGDSQKGRMGPRMRHWLTSQRLQPLLPIDTSWLSSGHVNELVAFLKAQDDSFRVLVADPGQMLELYELLSQKEKEQLPPRYEQLGSDTFRAHNLALQRGKLARLRERLKAGLALEDESFVPLPVAFTLAGDKNAACTVNLVNLQLINGHALVPKPLGPRVSPERASHLLVRLGLLPPTSDEAAPRKELQVLERVTRELEKALLAEPGAQQVKVDLKGSAGYWTWAPVGTDAGELARAHACTREELLERNPQRFDSAGQVTSGGLSDQRKDELTRFNRIWIPSETVDVLECYTQAVLEPLGYTVHFIDTSAYQALHGEVHAASNAQRTLPEGWDLGTCQRLWAELSLHDLSYRVD